MRRIAAALAVLAAMPLAAQQPAFKGGVDLVRIPLSITRSGQPVTEPLTLADVSVIEDGVPQAVAVFERETLPISLCIALDVSGSMQGGPVDLAVRAIGDVSAELRGQDEIAILAFAETSRIVIPWSSPAAAARLKPTADMGGETSLNDATRAALDLLESARNPRAIILLITDGFENASRLRLSDVVKSRRQSEAIVYAFAVQPDKAALNVDRFGDLSRTPGVEPPSPNVMQFNAPVSLVPALVGDSGGRMYQLTNAGDSRLVVRRFIDELRYQYTLGYTPAKPFDGKYRRVKIELKKRGYQVRHRGGYLAIPSKP
jgi:Ca-activated chloride channel family protein